MSNEGEMRDSSSQDEQKISQNQILPEPFNEANQSAVASSEKDGPVVNRTPNQTSGIPQILVTKSGSRDSDGSSECPTPVSAISAASGDDWAPSPAASLNLGLASPSSLMDLSSSESSIKLVVTQETSNSALEGVLSVMSDSSDTAEETSCGPLRAAANDKTELGTQNPHSAEVTRLPQLIEGHTCSPNNCQVEASNSIPDLRNNGTRESQTNDREIRAALVRKRVRVVQLLAVGLLSIFFGLFASVWAQVSCAFFTAEVVGFAGDDDTSNVIFEENLKYGLWRYSPGGDGEASCTSYGYDEEADATIIPRLAGVVAILGGLLAIGILFTYLVFGFAKKKTWEVAVVLAVMAGVSQLCTLLFLVVGVCEKYECIPGPGSMGTVISGFCFFILGFEMLYNMPRDSYAFESGRYPPHERPSTILRGFEMSDITEWFRSYQERIEWTSGERLVSSLNAIYRRRRREDNPLGEGIMLDHDMHGSHQIV